MILCINISLLFLKIKNYHSIDDDVYYSLAQLAKENDDISEIYNHYMEYPPEILELLTKDPDTLDFVKSYSQFKNNPTIPKNVGKLNGKIPLLLQWDPRWGYFAYGNNSIAFNGCAPTCLSMVICGLTQDNTITPYHVAKYSLDNNYYIEGTGTKWELMTKGAKHFGIKGKQISLNQSQIISELRSSHPLICSMGPGDFTNQGHFIVIVGYQNGKFIIHDPNSKKRSQKLWDYKVLSHQIKSLWTFHA